MPGIKVMPPFPGTGGEKGSKPEGVGWPVTAPGGRSTRGTGQSWYQPAVTPELLVRLSPKL